MVFFIEMKRSDLAHTPLRVFDWPNFSRRERFFHEVGQQTIDKQTVEYLPNINKLPTKMDTIQEVLCQVKEKAEALNLKEIDLVLDHVITAKLLRFWWAKETLTLDHSST